MTFLSIFVCIAMATGRIMSLNANAFHILRFAWYYIFVGQIAQIYFVKL